MVKSSFGAGCAGALFCTGVVLGFMLDSFVLYICLMLSIQQQKNLNSENDFFRAWCNMLAVKSAAQYSAALLNGLLLGDGSTNGYIIQVQDNDKLLEKCSVEV